MKKISYLSVLAMAVILNRVCWQISLLLRQITRLNPLRLSALWPREEKATFIPGHSHLLPKSFWDSLSLSSIKQVLPG